jgi:SAM-dependent methyltransferase
MNYRSYVGPEELYDVMGGLQFTILFELGLREEHTLLDIGCGSLRAGRLFIPYLNDYGYFGVEPNESLVRAGFENELGQNIYNIKHPSFTFNDTFNFYFDGGAPEGFDYILAQSIFTHATKQQVSTCVHNAAAVMHKDSIFVATYFNAVNGATGDDPKEWTYPSVVKYPYLLIKRIADEAGLTLRVLEKEHPVGQTWIILRKVQ